MAIARGGWQQVVAAHGELVAAVRHLMWHDYGPVVREALLSGVNDIQDAGCGHRGLQRRVTLAVCT